jgi:hypothetical protein
MRELAWLCIGIVIILSVTPFHAGGPPALDNELFAPDEAILEETSDLSVMVLQEMVWLLCSGLPGLPFHPLPFHPPA